jgi:small subunit ribosomal protein S5e
MADVEVETPVEETPYEEAAPVEEEGDVDEEFVAAGGATEVKLFGKWSFDDIEIRDMSLEVRIVMLRYISY